MENAGASRRELAPGSRRRAFFETFLVFLRLGLVSFGGPIAHIGYFRNEFVQRRRWIDEHAFSDLVALCQLLPGPASSQLGMAIGYGRAGWSGIAGAWLGFTLPSALALILFALGIARFDMLAGSGAVQGLKVVAVAVVAQAVLGMGRTLCPDRTRVGVAFAAFLLVLGLPRLLPGAVAVPALAQVAAIVVGGLLGRGLLALEPGTPGVVDLRVPARAGRLALVAFVVLLAGLPLLAAVGDSMLLRLIDGFYRAGALVFGGGHVVLPLLEAAVVPIGAVGEAQFLAGYGAAQAVPGPLFTFGAYLGALAALPLSAPQGVDALAALPASAPWLAGGGWSTWGPWACGLFFLVVIFLPGFLVLIAALPAWTRLRHRPGLRSTIAGVNAAVVGILLAALYDPVWTGAIRAWGDFLLALAAFLLLVPARLPPVLVVGLAALAGWAMRA